MKGYVFCVYALGRNMGKTRPIKAESPEEAKAILEKTYKPAAGWTLKHVETKEL